MRPHIANEIKAEDKNLSKILINERFKIDIFQREYRWEKKHIEALITDLSISFLNNYSDNHTIKDSNSYDCYYLGPIVLCNDEGSLSIVDGQQRLTSLTLLIIFLNHLQKNEKYNIPQNLQKDLKPFLFVNKDGEDTLILNIDSRNQLMTRLIENNELTENIDESDESVSNIINRYEDIKILFPEELCKTEIIPIFIQWLLLKVVLVEIKAFSMENAYLIFETMNDRGMNLNPTEMLKGFLLSKINDVDKSYELNDIWKNRVLEIKNKIGFESDLDFFRAWLRARYAQTIRPTKQGSENEDFEIIGTQFHTWVRKKLHLLELNDDKDFYFFIRSDFDFYSNIFIAINNYKIVYTDEHDRIYLSNYYPIADSLTYPIYLAPLSKLEDPTIVSRKLNIISKFIDIYTISRVLSSRAITQSSIRYSMYELVKSIRNLDIEKLKERLEKELEKFANKPYSPFLILHKMDNWGFCHYLFARLLFNQDKSNKFESLLRSRKQSSLVLYKFFGNDEFLEGDNETIWSSYVDSVAGHCLVYRYDVEVINSKRGFNRIKYLLKQNYMPEMSGIEVDSIIDFISIRDIRLREQINDLLKFEL